MNSEAPKVTVLMTAFNAGTYLRDALKSLLAQTMPKWRLVLIDNGSSDGSFDSIQEDPRITITQFKENIGRTPALSLALASSKSEFTAVLDADDVAHPDRLAKQLQFMESHTDVVQVGSHFSTTTLPSVRAVACTSHSGYVSHDLLAERNIFANSSVVFRTEFAQAVGGYNEEFSYAQDFDLTLRLAIRGHCYMLSDVLTSLRIHPLQTTANPESRMLRLQEEMRLFEFAGRHLKLTKNGRKLNRRRQALVHLEYGMTEVKHRNLRHSLSALMSAVKLDPKLTWLPYLMSGRSAPNLPVDESKGIMLS